MKTKIKAALQQAYKNLGITDEEVFERVASAAETFIKEEAGIENFVKGAEPMLKLYQSQADKIRGEYSVKLKDSEGKLKESGDKLKESEDKLKALELKAKELEDKLAGGNGGDKNIEDIVKAAVSAAVTPLQEKLTAFEVEKSILNVTSKAKTTFYANDYVKAYKEEADEAWERAAELYTATGSKLTDEEFVAKAKGYFDKAVAKKGVDTSKPFEGGDGDKDNLDTSSFLKSLQQSGRIPTDTK
jgi:hypothetical protein